jgi:hypothetical protein
MTNADLVWEKITYKDYIEDNDIFDLADAVYWRVIDHLGIEDKCVEDNPDDDGTQNTEFGRELYFLIEETILSEAKK